MSAPSELRRDPTGGGWVIIAAGRAARPDDFRHQPVHHSGGSAGASETCPFCPGRESGTPPEVAAVRTPGSAPDGPGWRVRVVPNKYPALLRGPEPPRSRRRGFFESLDGVGVHEVVIETPDHEADFPSLEPGQAVDILRTWRDRIREIESEPQYAYIQLFKNYGREAGASLGHPHSQIVATPIIPQRVRDEIEAAARFHAGTGDCLHCRLIEEESAREERLILRNEAFIVTAPYASRFPYEMHVHPLRHEALFSASGDRDLEILAASLQDVLGRFDRALDDPPFNLVLHQAPSPRQTGGSGPADAVSYHWHLEILPVLTRVAGFEWGTGFYINPVPPEAAAAGLRA